MVPFLLNEVCKLRGTDCLHCIYMLFCTVLNADKRDCQEHEKPVLPKKGLFSGPVFSRFIRFLFPANYGFYSKFAEASCLSPAK